MAKIYVVDLTKEERTFLLQLIKSGKHSARKINRARILLLANEGRMDREIAEALHTSVSTVQRTRQRFVEGSLENGLNERPRPGAKRGCPLPTPTRTCGRRPSSGCATTCLLPPALVRQSSLVCCAGS